MVETNMLFLNGLLFSEAKRESVEHSMYMPTPLKGATEVRGVTLGGGIGATRGRVIDGH